MSGELFSEFDGKAAAWLRAQGYCILAPEQVAQVRRLATGLLNVEQMHAEPHWRLGAVIEAELVLALLDAPKEER